MEFLGKGVKNEFVEKALGLDVWVSGGKVAGLEEEEKEMIQRTLRGFVVLAAGATVNVVRFSCVD